MPERFQFGRRVRCAGGYAAFVPDPLPPRVEWTADLIRALSDADRAIGRLAGESRRLPNPHLLIRPFVKREAVLSSRIEGTQATLGELLAAEAGAAVERSPADLREVANYVVALEHGVERLRDLPLSLRQVKELHEKLMRDVRGNRATPGGFRRSQNWIGPAGCTLADATFVPPPPDRLMECLGAWEKFLHDDTLPPLVHAARALAVRSHPPLPRRQRARRTAAHHAPAHRQGRAALAAPLPERLLRGHARGVLRAPARRDGARRVEGVARILPHRSGAAGRGRARPHPAHRRAARQLAGAAR